jgi:DNA excision repair protein ERCC-2
MKNLFPFDSYRKGQESFIKVVNTALENKKDVLAQIPTGVGKTAAVLSATLSYAIEHNKKVIFLTSKHTHHKIAIDTLRKIKEKYELDIKAIDFIGKIWMCSRQEVDTNHSGGFNEYCKHLIDNDECEFYRNFHNKARFFSNKILLSDLKSKILHIEELVEKCRNANVCPYEAASHLAKKSKVIIADYFHILDPRIRKTFLKKIDNEIEDSIIIWDEAHNLPNRARDLLSINISTISLDNCISEVQKYNAELEGKILEIKNKLKDLADKYVEKEILIDREEFISIEESFIESLEEVAEQVLEEKQYSYLKNLVKFLRNWDPDGKEFSRILKKTMTRKGKPMITLEKNCLDPAVVMKDIINEAHSNIFMSGTLFPLDNYKDLFGLNLPLEVDYPNPFPKENRLDLVVPVVSTKYNLRNDAMYDKIAKHCSKIIEVVPGNKIFFFPSYDLINKILPFLGEEKDFLIEESGMNKASREAILNRFRISKGNTLLAVSAGSFGEGIDLKGDTLSAVIIIGVPFGRFDLMSKEMIRYFEEKFENGHSYGYIMPAFVKVLQNAGRCIRSENDKGAIIYLDSRYVLRNYQKYFPESIDLNVIQNYDELEEFFK